MRLKKPSRMSKSWRLNKATLVKTFARVKSSMHFKWGDGATTIFLVATGVAVAVALSTALRLYKLAETSAANAPSKNVSAQARATRGPDATTSNALPATSASKPSAQQSPVTITGCLERNDETFRLKNATGVDAPKSRSWKSGFLKKNSASIEVIDRANRLQLTNHVGERVVVTGVLVDREMQVRSLRRVAASCNKEA